MPNQHPSPLVPILIAVITAMGVIIAALVARPTTVSVFTGPTSVPILDTPILSPNTSIALATNTPVIPTNAPAAVPSETFTPAVINTPTNVPVSTPRLSGCEWLQANFPQSPEGIATQFKLPVERITMIYENCTGISNGFVIGLGPEVQMTVPNGGCIDAPQDAGFSDATTPDGNKGLRAYSGTVRARVMTYRPQC